MFKRKLKKLTAIILACSMMLSLSSCGKKEKTWTQPAQISEPTVTEDTFSEPATEEDASDFDPDSDDLIDSDDCVYALPDPTGDEALAEQERFHDYLYETFQDEVVQDTLTLHYTVANPENYDLEVPEVTYGDTDLSVEGMEEDKQDTLDEIDKLKEFDYDLLTSNQKYTYDVLMQYLETDLDSYDCMYLYEPFARTSGLQSNIPITLSEYKFYNEKDIQDYLTLLQLLPDYVQVWLDYEKVKIEKGFFMNEGSAKEVVKQCQNYIAKPADNLLIATFENKVRGVDGLSEEQIQDYIQQNEDAVMNSIIPAYKNMINFFTKNQTAGKNELGLCYLDNGKEYYEYLLKYKVGTDKTPEEVIECLEDNIDECMSELTTLAMSDYEAFQQYYTDSEADGGLYGDRDALETIQYFEDYFSDRFPAMPDVDFKVENVHPSLKDIVSPAFYMTPQLDSYRDNSIYLNLDSDGAGCPWSTFAHEGIPGHMYQFTYYLDTQPEPLRTLLNFNGYTEGWATYVELMSYDAFDDYAEDCYADFERINGMINLLVSARIEIGVNYEGWDLEATTNYLNENGFNGEAAQDLMDYVIAEPVNYQMYVMGWLSFKELREYAEDELGSKFDEQEFHKVLLDAGPSQFGLLEVLVEQYVKDHK